MTIERELASEINARATEIYSHLRQMPNLDPDQAVFVCLMVMYHIWATSPSKVDFANWHTFVSAQLAQIHLDNTPAQVRQ